MTDEPDWFTPATSSQITQLIQNTQPIAGMPFGFTVSVAGAAAVQLEAAASDEVVILYNPSATDQVFVGGVTVTAATGIPIPPGGFHTWVIAANNILYGITLGATIAVRVTTASLV